MDCKLSTLIFRFGRRFGRKLQWLKLVSNIFDARATMLLILKGKTKCCKLRLGFNHDILDLSIRHGVSTRNMRFNHQTCDLAPRISILLSN
jgi:hypothetical protein